MYLLAHCLVLFLPGWLIARTLGLWRPEHLVCAAFGFSLTAVVVLIELAKRLNLSFTLFVIAWLLGLLACAILWFVFRKSERERADLTNLVPGLGVLALATLWLLWTGTYLEVPGDVLLHMEYLQSTLFDLGDGDFAKNFRIGIWSDPPNDHWYYLFSSLSIVTGTSFDSAIAQATLVNSLTVILIVWCFSLAVFARLETNSARLVAAALACVFFIAHFGVNTFSYIRYYALAPTILNFALYLSAVAMILRFSRSNGMALGWLAVVGVFTGAAWLMHEQEALFIALAGVGLSVVIALQRGFGKARLPDQVPATSVLDRLRLPWWLLAVGGVGIIGAGGAISHRFVERKLIYDSRLFISLQDYLPTTMDAWILNPAFQFYAAIGAWGCLVYVGFVLWFRTMRAHPFILVGMLMPLATIFNPFFADLFMRHAPANTFWRFSYMVPIAWAAALIVTVAFNHARSAGGASRVVAAFVIIGALACVALPAQLGSQPSWNRLPTLTPTPEANSVKYWADLIEPVRALPPRTTLHTDPVTGYVMTAMTTSRSMRYKFFRRKRSQLNPEFFSAPRLRRMHGHALIINRRNGSPSVNGRLARHWPEQITDVRAYYSEEFLEYVAAHPEIFRPLWSGDQVEMYRIADPARGG